MRPKNLSDTLLGAVFAIGGAVIVLNAQGLSVMPGLPVGPGLVPTITGSGMVIFGAVLAWQGWFAPAHELVGVPEEVADLSDGPAPAGRSWLDAWFIPLLLLATVAVIPLMPVLGFLVTGTIYTALVVVMCGGSLLRALIFSPVAAVAVYAVFLYGLQVPLPRGILG